MTKRLPSAVFLDRDGVINEEVGLLYRTDQLRLIPGAAQAIRKLNALNLPVIVVTNQSVVAHGLCTEETLAGIHEELKRQLAEQGASLSAIYYCPHHEDGEVAEYRRACDDRKPGIGMLQAAAADFGFQLQDCVLIGDRRGDMEAGRAAGCLTILVETGFATPVTCQPAVPDRVCRDLAEAVDFIARNGDEAGRVELKSFNGLGPSFGVGKVE
jgi:D-glycero-D-manno-heptose 1,7-bisphosphate phosphatase